MFSKRDQLLQLCYLRTCQIKKECCQLNSRMALNFLLRLPFGVVTDSQLDRRGLSL